MKGTTTPAFPTLEAHVGFNLGKPGMTLRDYFAARIAGEPWKASNHAEIWCIDKAMKQGKIVHSLVVTRFDSFGNMKSAKPCKTCNTAIDYFKIKNVYYSTEDKGMVKL